jgi:hypothetical protein
LYETGVRGECFCNAQCLANHVGRP